MRTTRKVEKVLEKRKKVSSHHSQRIEEEEEMKKKKKEERKLINSDTRSLDQKFVRKPAWLKTRLRTMTRNSRITMKTGNGSNHRE